MRLESVSAPACRSDANELRSQSQRPTEDRWLRSSEVARLLGVSSPNTIKNWFEGGHFPGAVQKTFGGHWRFLERDVLEMKRRMEELHERNRKGDHEHSDIGDDEPEYPL